jgi:hypothetical protein
MENFTMPRELMPLHAADVSTFAKSVRAQLATRLQGGAGLPSHVEMLNLLARAAGHRNVQALQAAPPMRPSSAPPSHETPYASARLSENAERALRPFDDAGRLTRWPRKHAVQRLALWGLWLRFDSRRRYSEPEVNRILNAHHGFGDHCTLRRELVEMQLLARTPDVAVYRKLAARPEPEVIALLAALRLRAAG